MQKDLRQMIGTMDVKLHRDQAYSIASDILSKGPAVLSEIIDLGFHVEAKESDRLKKKKTLRAVIFIIAFFVKKKAVSLKTLTALKGVSLLSTLSMQGYKSAQTVLHDLGFSDADIQKELLLSLPVVEPQTHDREISLAEALEEISMSKVYEGAKGIQSGCYSLGRDGNRSYLIYRTGKKLFTCRIRKIS
jgi:hypothetical protein